MQVEITFKNGDVWTLKTLHISDYKHYLESDEAYYIVPCRDILIGRVTPEEFQRCQKEAKLGAALGSPDLGEVLFTTKEKKPCKFNWVEVKDGN